MAALPAHAAGACRPFDEEAALRHILEGTAAATGEAFFRALVEQLAAALGVTAAWVTEYLPEERRLRALAFWFNGDWVPEYEYELSGTPCEPVVCEAKLVHIPEHAIELFPRDNDLQLYGAVSYMGAPLQDVDGRVLGNLAVFDNRPLPEEARCQAIFRIFAARAAAEHQRLRVERAVREREQKLSRLVDSAMDSILEFDGALAIVRANPAAEKVFGCGADAMAGESLTARRVDGSTFEAEATISSFEMEGDAHYTLILRDISDRLAADAAIQTLTDRASYLQEELRKLSAYDELLGESAPMLALIQAIEQVAATDATVLILGESGTGKSVAAGAIHARSPRAKQPMVCVNCAAVPANLIESEFFGHEAGAFTGATARREGRFSLADGGTIFLDEIGDMPLDLQAKLLRVLRDVVLLAQACAQRRARRFGRKIAPFTEAEAALLKGYTWPGNVRELENVIERALILSSGPCLALAAAMPAGAAAAAPGPPAESLEEEPVLRDDEVRALERDNIVHALKTAGGKISGANGAAALLDLPASTLTSRMKSLGIQRKS